MHSLREMENRGATIVVSGGMYVPPIVTPCLVAFLLPPVGRAGYKRSASAMTPFKCVSVDKSFALHTSRSWISSYIFWA